MEFLEGTEKNVVLIGMPAVGKSTVGVLLAKALSRDFLDTDVLIQAHEGCRLQELIARYGREAFCRLEERYLLSLKFKGKVVATGGSAVYSPRAMASLAASGPVVYLHLPLEELMFRIGDTGVRGVVISPGQTFEQLFEERRSLYEAYADLTVSCSGLGHDETVRAVIAALEAAYGSGEPE